MELSHRTKIIAATDVLALAELVLSIFLASRVPEEFTPVFVKSFFAMMIPTLVVAFAALRMYGRREAQPE